MADKPGKAQYLLNDCIYLLRIDDEEQSHYVYIKHIDRLVKLHHHLIDKDKRFCPICEKGVKLNEYTRHVSQCYAFSKDSTLLRLPPAGSKMKFNNYKNMLERPFYVIYDGECSLCPTDDDERIARHEPNSQAFYLVCTCDYSKNRLWKYVGEDCAEKLLIELTNTWKECLSLIHI